MLFHNHNYAIKKIIEVNVFAHRKTKKISDNSLLLSTKIWKNN